MISSIYKRPLAHTQVNLVSHKINLRVPPPSQLLLKKVLTPLTPVTMETFVKKEEGERQLAGKAREVCRGINNKNLSSDHDCIHAI